MRGRPKLYLENSVISMYFQDRVTENLIKDFKVLEETPEDFFEFGEEV